jgi:membrane-associated phospholipid phosphatase
MWTTLISAGVVVGLTTLAWVAVMATRPAARRIQAASATQRLVRGVSAGRDWLIARIAVQLLVLAAGAAAVFAFGALFAEVTEAVVDQDGLTALDRPVLRWLATHRGGGLTRIQIGITNLGNGLVLTVLLLAAVTAVALRLRSWRPVALTVTAAGGIQSLVYAIKVFIGRSRPELAGRLVNATGFSFPSGHSAAALVCFGMLAWLTCMTTRNRMVRATAWVAAALITLAIGVSRAYLGVHYPSDVIGGWVLGGTWLAALAVASYLTRIPRRSRRTTGESSGR